MSGMLYATSVPITNPTDGSTPQISLVVPTVGYVLDHEDDYYAAAALITATPYDMMVQLDDVGIDFSTIDAFDLFCMLVPKIAAMDTTMLFSGVDFKKLRLADNERNGLPMLIDPVSGVVIDRVVHHGMAKALRDLLGIEEVNKKPGNEDARQYMLKLARTRLKRQKRNAKKGGMTQLEKQIVAAVNDRGFKYDYESVRGLSIFQFNQSLNQIDHFIHYDKLMIGYYAGTVKGDDIQSKDRTWMLS